MKNVLFTGLFALGLLLTPAFVSAQPIPNKCMTGSGQIKCDNPQCRQFCTQKATGKKGNSKHNSGMSPKDAGRNDGPHRDIDRHNPPRRDADRNHPVGKADMQLERRIQELADENARLGRMLQDKNAAMHACMRMPKSMHSSCNQSYYDSQSIQRRIDENNHKIESLKREQRMHH